MSVFSYIYADFSFEFWHFTSRKVITPEPM